MRTINTVEEYLWWIANLTDDHGNLDLLWKYVNATSLARITLARYDVGIVLSMADQTATGQQLTDRQFDLAKRIIVKYTRQLKTHGIQVPHESALKSKNGIRTIDRQREMWIDERSIICVKFPFISNMVNDLRNEATSSHGFIRWNREKKVWDASLTESNVNWVVAYGQAHSFIISDQLLEIFHNIIAAEKVPYAIELVKNSNGEYIVNNAEDSLHDYIKPLGQDLLKLADYSGICEYTLEDEIVKEILAMVTDQPYATQHGIVDLCKGRIMSASPITYPIDIILTWAEKVDRLPVIVYDPGASYTSEIYQSLIKNYGIENVLVNLAPSLDKNNRQPGIVSSKELTLTTKAIYTNKMLEDIPTKLLISLASLFHGKKKQRWLRQFEKIVYFEYIK